MKYMLGYGGVYRLPDYAFIPESMDNKDWITYQEWLAAGNAPAPNSMPPPVVIEG